MLGKFTVCQSYKQPKYQKSTHGVNFKIKKKVLSFRCYLDFLSNRDNFGYGAFDEFYPGLCQKLDRLNVTPEKLTKTRVSNIEVKKIDTRVCTEVINNRPLGGTYCVGYHAAISTTVEYALRLRHDLPHKIVWHRDNFGQAHPMPPEGVLSYNNITPYFNRSIKRIIISQNYY